MDLAYEYRCTHCRHTEDVTVVVREEGSLQNLSAESALAFRACPRCRRRDWLTVGFRLFVILAIGHVSFGFLVFALGLGGRTLRGLSAIVEQGPAAIALAWAAVVILTIFGTLSEWSSRPIRAHR